MKKLIIVAIALAFLASNTGVVFAAPGDNPNGFLALVSCGDKGDFWVWKPDEHAMPALTVPGNQVGIAVSLYIDNGDGYELLWKLPGKGVFRNTTFCTFEENGMPLASDVMIR